MRLCPNWPSISDICIECLIPLRQVIWGDIWKCTPVKAKQMQPVWPCFLSGSQVCDTFETYWTKIHINNERLLKIHMLCMWMWNLDFPSHTNAISVVINLFELTFWEDIFKHTVGRSKTNATNVTLHPLRQALWEHI